MKNNHTKLHFSKDNDRFYKLLELIILRDDLQEKISTIRTKYEIEAPKNGVAADNKIGQTTFLPYHQPLLDDVRDSLDKLTIPQGWFGPVLLYTLNTHNDDMNTVEQEPEGVTMEVDPLFPSTIVLRLGARATHTDLEKAWDKVKELRGKASRETPSRQNPERDLAILSLHKKGLSLPQISIEIEKKFPLKRDGHAVLEDGLTEEHIREIIRRAYKRTGLSSPELK